MTLGRFTHTTCLKVSTGASDSSMFSKDFSPFLVLFQNYVGCCQHPQSFLFYHPFNVYTVQSQSMDKSSLLSSMYHQGIRLFLFSCTDVLIMLAFVLRLDSSWSQNSCLSSSYHILTQQCPKFGSGVRGTFPFLYLFLKLRTSPKTASQLIGQNSVCAHFHDNSLQGRIELPSLV